MMLPSLTNESYMSIKISQLLKTMIFYKKNLIKLLNRYLITFILLLWMGQLGASPTPSINGITDGTLRDFIEGNTKLHSNTLNPLASTPN